MVAHPPDHVISGPTRWFDGQVFKMSALRQEMRKVFDEIEWMDEKTKAKAR